MKKNFVTFKNLKFGELRTMYKDGQVWFVGKDVATVLGYSNTSKAIRMHVDEEKKINCIPKMGTQIS